MRLAYQAGVLRALEEEQLVFTHADGTSGGIMNLGMLLSGLSPDEMCKRWRSLRAKDFVSYLPLREYLNIFRLKAFGDADGVINKVFPRLGIDVRKIHNAHGLEGTFNVCNFSDKTNQVIHHRDVTLEHMVAGMSLPIFMPAVKIGRDWHSDSVWIKDANLWEAVKRGAEEIWLVWAIGNARTYRAGSFYQYVHMIEMSANGCLFEEFDRIIDLNERIVHGDSPYGQQKPIILHVIKPEYPLPLDPDYYFNRIDAASLIDMGYADAKRHLRKREPVPFLPSATQMRENEWHLLAKRKWTGSLDGQFQGKRITLNLTLSARGAPEDWGATASFPSVGHFDCGDRTIIPIEHTEIQIKCSTDRTKLDTMEMTTQFVFEGTGYRLTATSSANKGRLNPTGDLRVRILRLDDPNDAVSIGELKAAMRPVSGWLKMHVIQAPGLFRGIKAKFKLWKLLALGLLQ